MSQFAGQLGPSASYTQAPRFIILLNGVAVQYPLSAEVNTNNYSEAARFNASFACTQAGAVQVMSLAQIALEIQISLNGGSPVSLVYGFVDTVELDPLSLHVTVTGRDLAALLLDTPIQKPFENLTSSQVIAQFITEHAAEGLKGSVTNTTGSVGRFYGVDYDATKYGDLYRPTNEWSMALMLAQGEGFDLRLGGRDERGKMLSPQTLYFGPPAPSENTVHNLVVDYGPPIQSNAESIHISRSLTLAKDVQVNVIGWNSLQTRPIIQRLKASNTTAPKGGYGPVQNYTFRMPGDVTPQQALAYAQMKMREVTAFERVVSVVVPGELELTPASPVKLTGTGTSADQVYFIDQITRSISFEHGFHEEIRLKNHSPYNITPVS